MYAVPCSVRFQFLLSKPPKCGYDAATMDRNVGQAADKSVSEVTADDTVTAEPETDETVSEGDGDEADGSDEKDKNDNVGKRIKMEGIFSIYYDGVSEKNYFACIIMDAGLISWTAGSVEEVR